MGAGAAECARPFRLGAWTRATALSAVRARCGCIARREAESSIGEANALAAALENADDFARDWGCPAAGCAPRELTGELTALAKHTARVVGIEPATTCPFACLMRADPWVAEMSDAARIAEAYHTPLPDILGRPLTAADVAALSEIQRGRADAWESDEKIREESRPKR